MGTIGCGYGSEWHLLRYLGYHRLVLDAEVLRITGALSVQWIDCKFSNKREPLLDDQEWSGVAFIDDPDVKGAYALYWATTGKRPCWDAIGELQTDKGEEWILVEAKAHTGELSSACAATNKKNGLDIITRALEATASEVTNNGIPTSAWLRDYYQYANRLATLHFLTSRTVQPVPAHVLFIYFYGDKRPDNHFCPASAAEWTPILTTVKQALDINPICELMNKVHNLFLDVHPFPPVAPVNAEPELLL